MPRWSELASGGIVSQSYTILCVEVNARSVRVDVLFTICVGSDTICDKQKDDIILESLLNKGVVGNK